MSSSRSPTRFFASFVEYFIRFVLYEPQNLRYVEKRTNLDKCGESSRRLLRHLAFEDRLGLLSLCVVLLITLKGPKFFEMVQSDITDSTHRLLCTGRRHLLKILKKCLVARDQLVNVPEQNLRFICRDDSRIFTTRKLSKWVGIRVLEQAKALNIVSLGRDKLVDKIRKRAGIC